MERYIQGKAFRCTTSILKDGRANLKWFSAMAGAHDADRNRRGADLLEPLSLKAFNFPIVFPGRLYKYDHPGYALAIAYLLYIVFGISGRLKFD